MEAVEDATHIVYPPPPPNPVDEDYVRPLDIRGKHALVHTWYYPDRYVGVVHGWVSCAAFSYLSVYCSYDSLVALTEMGGVTPESPPVVPKQWLVSSRWLTDTDNFNEWMNEEDYQLIIVVSSYHSNMLMVSPPHVLYVAPLLGNNN